MTGTTASPADLEDEVGGLLVGVSLVVVSLTIAVRNEGFIKGVPKQQLTDVEPDLS